MPKIKDGYYITEEGKRRFKIWLLDNDLSLPQFAAKAGCSRQYLQRVIDGKVKVTENVRERFLKGGYEII